MIQLPEIGPLLSDRPLTALPLAFLGGVLTSLTPCIYPMIPITASIVGGQAVGSARPSKRRAVALTFAYVLGLALVYAALGLLAGMTGTMFGTVSTSPWLHLVMANLLILAALAMLDVIPIRLPAALTTRAHRLERAVASPAHFSWAARRGSSRPMLGAVMAAVLTGCRSQERGARSSTLCLLARDVHAARRRRISVGVLGVLPRAGAWMIWVKRLFALIMLIVAEYYLVRMGGLLI